MPCHSSHQLWPFACPPGLTRQIIPMCRYQLFLIGWCDNRSIMILVLTCEGPYRFSELMGVELHQSHLWCVFFNSYFFQSLILCRRKKEGLIQKATTEGRKRNWGIHRYDYEFCLDGFLCPGEFFSLCCPLQIISLVFAFIGDHLLSRHHIGYIVGFQASESVWYFGLACVSDHWQQL